MEAPGVLVDRADPTRVFLGQARSQACLSGVADFH